MKFDVVIGNPPYNNDLYLDFVQLGYQLSSNYVCMITPAKWQAKGGGKNEAFRKNIVPRMSGIVYYPDCGELFDIHLLGGITYYLIDKNIHLTKNVLNKSQLAQLLNSKKDREITYNGNCIVDNQVYEILNRIKIETYENFFFACSKTTGNYCVVITHMVNTNAGSSNQHTFTLDGNLLVLSTLTINTKMPTSNNYICLFRSDSLERCKSFISYVNTRFIRFLIFGSIIASSLRNQETWRFVPAPDAFDHIFTDEELYKKYNLTQEEINIIESVIKERKQK